MGLYEGKGSIDNKFRTFQNIQYSNVDYKSPERSDIYLSISQEHPVDECWKYIPQEMPSIATERQNKGPLGVQRGPGQWLPFLPGPRLLRELPHTLQFPTPAQQGMREGFGFAKLASTALSPALRQ